MIALSFIIDKANPGTSVSSRISSMLAANSVGVMVSGGGVGSSSFLQERSWRTMSKQRLGNKNGFFMILIFVLLKMILMLAKAYLGY